jgi:hypothetical protein
MRKMGKMDEIKNSEDLPAITNDFLFHLPPFFDRDLKEKNGGKEWKK